MRKNIKTQILIDEGSYPFLYGFQKQKFCLEILSIPFHKKSAAGRFAADISSKGQIRKRRLDNIW